MDDLGGFTYVQQRGAGSWVCHEILRVFYAPLNWIDRHVFGGPEAMHSSAPMGGLSQVPPDGWHDPDQREGRG